MIKFLHCADLHLDSPFRALPPEKAAVRRREQRQILEELTELCNTEQCDLLLLSGDLFDAETVWRDTLDVLLRCLRTCRARVFIAPGNHDFYAPGSPYAGANWPENVHIFKSSQLESVVIEELGCEVWGAAFTGPTAPALLEGFRVSDPSLYQIMVLHGDAETPGSPYNPITRAQIEGSGLDYLALGHIHQASGLLRAGKTTYGWPGCPMGRGFDETGEKGVYLGTLSRAGCQVEFRPLSGRRYEILRVEAGEDPLAAIEAALPPDTGRDIYRILLTGVSDPPDVRALYRALEDRFFGLTIRDETTPRRDPWEGCGEDTLQGLFLQTLRDAPGRKEDPALYDLAAAFGSAVLEGREVAEP